jgi:tetratricopeptide (TPR) repeat protein
MAMVSLQSCYDRARQCSSKGEYDQAEAVCRHILQYYPQDLGTFQLLGQINLEQKRAREARDYFRQVLEIDPENVSAHWGMGIAYQDEGKLEQAIAEFEQALEIKPDLSDLRNQLLRAYTDLYGASRAQLRLSRAGLGRLYVKGEMYDKAVEEFREVLKVDPSRADVQLSLIEVLWQRGQTDEAARVSEAVLDRLPNALKANLILGYSHLTAGRQEEGEKLWHRAAACDPNNTMARAIFEMAPTRITQSLLPYDAATLPEFDEAAWKERLAAVAAAPAPAERRPEREVLPEVPAPPKAPAPPAERRPEAGVMGVSWLETLATGEGRVEEIAEEEIVPGLAPFSLEGLGEAGVGLPAEAEAGFAPEGLEQAAPAEPEAGFSLEALKEAPAGPPEMPAAGFAPEGLEEAAAGLPGEAAAPFTLEEEPLAAAAAPVREEGPTALAPRAEDQVMRPFSLEELGLSPDEIASLEEAVAAAKQEGTAAGELPTPAGAEAGFPEEFLPGVAPFSLEEVPAPGAGEEELAIPGLAPFTLEEVGAPAVPEEAALPGVEPFSLDTLGLGEVPAGEPIAAEAGGELKPFSLEDLGLEEPAVGAEAVGLEEVELDMGAEVETALPAFSWQEPGSREAPAFRGELARKEEEPVAGPSLFEKMMAGRREVPGPEEVAPAGVTAEAPAAEEEAGLKPFSLEELGAEAAAPAAAEVAPEELAPPGIAPFSIEELGLGEAAAPVAAEARAEAPRPFSLAELGLEETLPPVPEEAGLEALKPFSLEGLGLEGPAAAVAEEVGAEALKPFSLEELGLEEPAGPALPEVAPAEELAGVAAFSLEEMGLEGPPAAAKEEAPAEMVPVAEAAAPAGEVIKPFTLEELGLTPEEIASLGLSEQEMAAIEAAPAVEVPPTPVKVAPPVAEVAPPVVEEVVAPAVEEVVPPVVGEAIPVPVAVEAPPEAVAVAAAGPSLEELRQQHAAQPADENLLLALARACAEQGEFEEAVGYYKGLVKTGRAGLEDDILANLQVWIEQEQDPKRLHRLHRLLGDAYMKKGWYQQAINEYAWVLSKK